MHQKYPENSCVFEGALMNGDDSMIVVSSVNSGSLIAINFADPYDSSFCVIHALEIICTSLVIMLVCIVLFAVDILRIY